MEIIPLIYGESVLPESAVFLGGDKEVERSIVFKLYRIKEKDKLILIDAGCETMPGFVMRNFIGTVKALENAGVYPYEITDLVITHSHHDHIECAKYFKNAVIHIQEDEFESGKKYIPDGFKVNVFSESFFVTSSVTIIKIGGHSKGSCVVEIKHNGRTYVVAGDECYSRECLAKKIPTGSFVNKEKSIEFINKYSDGKYDVLLCHD